MHSHPRCASPDKIDFRSMRQVQVGNESKTRAVRRRAKGSKAELPAAKALAEVRKV